MRARRPNLANAATELGFAVGSFACGLFGAPIWVAGLATFALLAYWSWTRRVQLNSMRGMRWVRTSLISITLIIVIMAGAYWFGLLIHGAA